MKPKKAAVTFLTLCTFLLAACGGSKRCSEEIWNGEFGLCLARGWEQIADSILREQGIPEETIAAYHMTSGSGQRDNVVVSRETLGDELSALEYANANVQTIEVMPEYNMIEKREAEIDDEPTFLHIFTARPVPDLPARRFYQLSLVDRDTGYTFTGTLPFSVDSATEKALIEMLLSATLQE